MPYLENDEYISRFGNAETIRLTDEERTGTIDSAKLEEAISDAEEEADGYLGKKYTIPLASPPRLVKGIVAVLARFKLYKSQVPQSVKDEADLARKQLRDLSTGVMVLPGIDGGIAPEDGRPVAESVASGDGPATVFSDSSMAGFGVGTGFRGGAWRN